MNINGLIGPWCSIGLTALLLLLTSCGGGSPDDSGKNVENTPLRSAVATAVGEPTGDATSTTIGIAGGSVRTADGEILLTIPSGALTSDTAIGVEPIISNAPGGLGTGYRLTPDGQTFERPIRVTFAYGDLDLAGTSAQALGIATQTAEGYWQWLDGAVVDQEAETVTITTGHLSDYSLVEGFQIWPYFRQLHTGEQVAIKVIYCYRRDEFKPSLPPDSDEDELAPLVLPEHDDDLAPLGDVLEKIRCDMNVELAPLLPIPDVLAWKVNGVEGGDSRLGTIAKRDTASATYTAPSSSPDPNTVTVSADLPWGEKGKMVATALIEISASGRAYEGSLRYSHTSPDQSVTLAGDVTWIEGGPGSDSFLASGTMQLNISAECSRQDDKGRLQKGEMKFAGAVRFEGEMYLGVPAEDRHAFVLGTNSDDAQLVCNGIAVPYAVLLTSQMCDVMAQNSSQLGDGRSLTGSTICAEDGMQLEWSFVRTR